VPFYEMAAIDELTGTLRTPTMVPLASCRSGKTKFRNGDVLFARITPCVQNGKSALVTGVEGGIGFGSTEFYVLRAASKALPEYLFLFLRQESTIRAAVDTFTGSSNRQRVPLAFWDRVEVPVPPLPVQERIVRVLQKADEVRQKRRKALEVADAILPASFVAMFGNPIENGGRFERVPLGELADVRAGVAKGRKLHGRQTVEVPYLRVANVQDGFLDLSEVKTIEVPPGDVERYRLEPGDVLMVEGCGNPSYLGRGCMWHGEIPDCIHQNHIFRARTDRQRLLPEVLAALLRTQYANGYFRSCAKNSSGLANINGTQVKAFPVPLPPIGLQVKFVNAVHQWTDASAGLVAGLKDAGALFTSLANAAFSGELTAEWEAANADWIAEQMELQERLPRLLLLALIRERAARAVKAARATVLVTALMKYAFLLQMEGNGGRRFYHFIPYHYGPFAKEVYSDLERLQAEGLVSVDEDSEQEKTRITVADPARVEAALAEVPNDLKQDVAAVLDAYGDLDHNALLRTVYKKYPAYARVSRARGRAQARKRE
jgi:type I restriction enzyme S subunit